MHTHTHITQNRRTLIIITHLHNWRMLLQAAATAVVVCIAAVAAATSVVSDWFRGALSVRSSSYWFQFELWCCRANMCVIKSNNFLFQKKFLVIIWDFGTSYEIHHHHHHTINPKSYRTHFSYQPQNICNRINCSSSSNNNNNSSIKNRTTTLRFSIFPSILANFQFVVNLNFEFCRVCSRANFFFFNSMWVSDWMSYLRAHTLPHIWKKKIK